MKKESRFSQEISIRNRKASYEYQFVDTYEAGIALKGSEIKSISRDIAWKTNRSRMIIQIHIWGSIHNINYK